MPINRRQFALSSLTAAALPASAEIGVSSKPVAPGVWKITLGEPEAVTPLRFRSRPPAAPALARMSHVSECPLVPKNMTGRRTSRGFVVSLPLAAGELVYGFGLQLKSHMQRGRKKTLRVNADPLGDTGDTHAPVPFYVTTGGYGVLVDTARYAAFYCGSTREKADPAGVKPAFPDGATPDNVPPAYLSSGAGEQSRMVVDIPSAAGVDVYIFAGPTMREAVSRYNLFSGGGCLPARWGLGVWYRAHSKATQKEALELANEFRDASIPCDVLGLEPGWHTHAYSSTFVWSQTFPDPKALIDDLKARGMKLNAWEHAYTHPTSPIFEALKPYAGDHMVFGGLAPDFTLPEARRIFQGIHQKEHVSIGLSGYKLDECDNSDYTGGWSFPEFARFPSGLDGEQMHTLIGILYQRTINELYTRQNRRTYGLVRSSGAVAGPEPFVLYSDLYGHDDYIRGMANAGFSGLLWCPEVRDANSTEDLIRRLQTVIFSPLAQVDAWYIKNPPWKQVNRRENNAGRFAEGWKEVEAQVRKTLEVRMQLVPYLYSAFARYRLEGLPPFRALVMDYPEDPQTWTVDDQWVAGEVLLVAPVVAGSSRRKVYLPKGVWHDFWTGEALEGGRKLDIKCPLDRIPVYVKDGAVLPLAEPALNTADRRSLELEVRIFGDGRLGCTVFEDDGVSLDFDKGVFNRLELTWDADAGRGLIRCIGAADCPRYHVNGWKRG